MHANEPTWTLDLVLADPRHPLTLLVATGSYPVLFPQVAMLGRHASRGLAQEALTLCKP